MNFRGVAFCFLLFFLFFSAFVVCRLWNLVPRSEVGGRVLLLNLLWLCDEDEAGLLNGGKMRLVRGGDKYLTMTKVKHSGFLT
jgi:hypothetical protein